MDNTAKPAATSLCGMRLCLTGGTGFVGRHLLPALVAAGIEVTCIVRGSSQTQGVPSQVRIVPADLATGRGLAAAMQGQDVVVHMAAVLFGLGWQNYLQDNVVAAQHMAMAAQQAGVVRFLHISSLAASGPSVAPGVDDDVVPQPVSAYGWSKFMAEQTLGRSLQERLVVLRPPIIYGSGDRGLLPYFTAARRGLVVTPGFRRAFPVSIIHVYDMVRAVLCCLLPQARGVYHCNDGQVHDMGQMGLCMAQVMGCKAYHIGMPLPIMRGAAAVSGLVGQGLVRMGRRAPSWNMDKYREASQVGWVCRGARIRDELGFIPEMNMRAGVAEAVSGYKVLGWL